MRSKRCAVQNQGITLSGQLLKQLKSEACSLQLEKIRSNIFRL